MSINLRQNNSNSLPINECGIIKESKEPSGVKARDDISDEISRMSTGAEINEKLICVDWLNFEGAGAYFRLDYQVIITFISFFA